MKRTQKPPPANIRPANSQGWLVATLPDGLSRCGRVVAKELAWMHGPALDWQPAISQPAIAQRTGYSLRSVGRAFRELRDRGVITYRLWWIRGRRPRSMIYRLRFWAKKPRVAQSAIVADSKTPSTGVLGSVEGGRDRRFLAEPPASGSRPNAAAYGVSSALADRMSTNPYDADDPRWYKWNAGRE